MNENESDQIDEHVTCTLDSQNTRMKNSSSSTCYGPKNTICYFSTIFITVLLTFGISYVYHNFSSLKSIVRYSKHVIQIYKTSKYLLS